MTNCVSLCLSLSVAVVGLERTAYTVSEDVVVVEVCAIVYSPNNSCPINFPFDVRLATGDATAGKSNHKEIFPTNVFELHNDKVNTVFFYTNFLQYPQRTT